MAHRTQFATRDVATDAGTGDGATSRFWVVIRRAIVAWAHVDPILNVAEDALGGAVDTRGFSALPLDFAGGARYAGAYVRLFRRL